MKKLVAELIGTFWLVLGGCGSAVLAAAFPEVGIGLVGVSLAFGLTVLTIAYSLGHISGAHLNPAVSIGLWAGGRFSSKDLLPYIAAQILGGILAAGVLYVIATGNGTEIGNFAANGYGEHSPGKYSLLAALININSSDQYSGNQYFCKSCPKHQSGCVCWWLGRRTTLAFYFGSDCWRCFSRTCL
jgi:aquaporin Z